MSKRHKHRHLETVGNGKSQSQLDNQFVDWLCGEKVEFPYFQNTIEVRVPEGFPFKENHGNK